MACARLASALDRCAFSVSTWRERVERALELHGYAAEAGAQVAKLNDLAADGQCRQQPRALHWFGLVRQGGEPGGHAAFPSPERRQPSGVCDTA